MPRVHPRPAFRLPDSRRGQEGLQSHGGSGGSVKPPTDQPTIWSLCNPRSEMFLPLINLADITCGPQAGSLELARALRDEFAQRCGGAAPALVASTLHRRKVDLNRAHELAFERGGGGSAPWGCYHAALAAALEEAVGRAGFALLLDVCSTGLVSPPTTCSRARISASGTTRPPPTRSTGRTTEQRPSLATTCRRWTFCGRTSHRR